MSKADNLKDFLVDLANAIREKKNKTGIINPQDFSAEILSIIAGDVQMPNVSGTLVITEGITEEDYEALKLVLGNNITIDAQGGIYIHFQDPEILRVLLANITPNDGVGITTAQAEAVTSIGTWFKENKTIETFDEFEKFTGVKTLNARGEWNTNSFYECSNLKKISLPSSMTTIDAYAFFLLAKLEFVTFANVNVISLAAFNGCTSLDIIIPHTVVELGSSAFMSCKNLRSIIFTPNLKKLGVKVFNDTSISGVANLGEITKLANEKTSQWRGVFYNCTNMKYAILPSTLTDIELLSFQNCSSLEGIILKNVTPATIESSTFDLSNNCPIYVPDTSVEAYKTATNWSSHADRIKGISNLQTDNPTLYEEVKEYL